MDEREITGAESTLYGPLQKNMFFFFHYGPPQYMGLPL